MGRRAKPAKGKSEAKRPRAGKPPKNGGSTVRDLEKRLAEALEELQTRNRDLTVALEQQTATAEILRVISRSPTDIQPVLDTVAESAADLCESFDAAIYRCDGDRLLLVAHHGAMPFGPIGGFFLPLVREAVAGRSVLDRRTIHLVDLQAEAAEFPKGSELAQRFGYRTTLSVPLMREGVAIGVIAVLRPKAQPFTERQVTLLQTFADQAVIAIENVRLFNETKEALEQQTATAEILRVISRSPTDAQPVFATIVKSAVRLCEAAFATVNRFDGALTTLGAHYNLSPEELEVVQTRVFPFRPTRATVSGRALLDRATVHVHDIGKDPEYTPVVRALERYRTGLSVPMLRDGVPIGTITLWRGEVRPFSDKQIAMIESFADQAVIAVENVRLFTELQTSNRELTTALDKQTATSDILRVISRTQTDVQPVFDAILASAVRLLRAKSGVLTRVADDQIELAASTLPGSEEPALRAAAVEGSHAQVIRERAPVNIADMQTDPRVSEGRRALARAHGYRSLVAVPLLRQDEALGAIAVTRPDPGGFAAADIALLRTFADQAVIAIENVRLFNETKEALEQQTATSEILRVISSSPTDVQPVFDTIAANAVRLCDGLQGGVYTFDGSLIHFVAHHNFTPKGLALVRSMYPRAPSVETVIGAAIQGRIIIEIRDFENDNNIPAASVPPAHALGYRSMIVVPMLREGLPIGALAVPRVKPGPFSVKQIDLLKTFADQAVIAIENVRLFKELEARTHDLTRSVGELRALGEVGQAISSTLDLRTVLSTIAARATQLSGTDAGVIYEYDEQREIFLPRATEHLEAEIVETMLATPVRKGEGATGQLAEVQESVQVPDILAAPAESRVRGALVRAGYRALLAVPLVREGHLLGGLTVIRKTTGMFAPEVVELLQTFATQSSLAIQNARLFLEIEDKSRQLEAASQHKSEFLANMSHELRTPLNAIIGFSEVLTARMFGELNEKQDEYLKDIYASGQHLLSLINDILDLSKIEAGRMELELTDFDLPSAIDNALTLVRERAGRRGITLGREIDGRVGMIRGDERKVKQVLLNLLSNAIKFNPEGGRIDVRAAMNDELVEVAVADTGVGIAPEDQEKVFEEFRQVGTADKKVEGTGLGLALSRKFIGLHGGRIWVQSELGHGSTFTFTLPVRPGE